MKQNGYARSFFNGFARALDLRGAVRPTYLPPQQSVPATDAEAVAADWTAVWNDLGTALDYGHQQYAAAGHER